ncbi:MAG: hypothetical protein HZB80_02290 [Deltaproteobacteria bacterium]|nr:hypothetical protein [Deltaproteobacteria bacterium]
MKLLNNERGAILITMLLLMVIVTLIGVIAINTTTVDMQITGNLKRVSTAFEGAEAGIDLAIPIIENSLASGQLTTSNTAISTAFNFTSGSGTTASLDTTNSPSLGDEITGSSSYNTDTPNSSPPDLSITNLNGVAVNVDIDRLYSYALPGGSLEFAAGYEGVGVGAAGGGAGVLYSIDSQGTIE